MMCCYSAQSVSGEIRGLVAFKHRAHNVTSERTQFKLDQGTCGPSCKHTRAAISDHLSLPFENQEAAEGSTLAGTFALLGTRKLESRGQ